jgi:hypothetical protein
MQAGTRGGSGVRSDALFGFLDSYGVEVAVRSASINRSTSMELEAVRITTKSPAPPRLEKVKYRRGRMKATARSKPVNARTPIKSSKNVLTSDGSRNPKKTAATIDNPTVATP